MKKIKVLLFIALALFYFSGIAYAEWQIDLSEWQNWLYSTQGQWTPDLGPSLRGHFATKPECEKARSKMKSDTNTYERSKCVGYDSPKQGGAGGTTPVWGGGNLNTDAGAKQLILGNMLGAILGGIFEDQSSVQTDTRAQQELLWQKKQAAIEKEKERKAALAKWKALKDASALQRAEEQHQKKEQGRKLLASLNRVGSEEGPLSMEPVTSGSPGPFGRGNLDLPTNELQPIGTGRYDTSSLSPLKRASCAQYFSQAAAKAAARGDDRDAEFLSGQAQKVMAGQMTDRECQFPGLPDVPEVPKPVKAQPVSNQKTAAYYEGLIKAVQQDAGKLRDIKMKLEKTDKKIKQAKEKKQKAEQKISKIKKSAALAKKPQEKQEADNLLASAQALLQESQGEIQAATTAKQALSKKKEQIMTKLKKIQKKIQPKTEKN